MTFELLDGINYCWFSLDHGLLLLFCVRQNKNNYELKEASSGHHLDPGTLGSAAYNPALLGQLVR